MQQQTIGRYQVLEEIASGGQGTVYRAWDTGSGRVVALKVLHPHLASDLGVLERFRREAQLAAAVVHPNITTIYEVGQHGNNHFIAMEYLPDSIHNLIVSTGRLPTGGGRAGSGESAGNHPPGHQAAEPAVGAGRDGEGDGLRHSPCDGAFYDDPDGGVDGDTPLHVSGAGAGSAGGHPVRYLLVGDSAVPDADWAVAL